MAIDVQPVVSRLRFDIEGGVLGKGMALLEIFHLHFQLVPAPVRQQKEVLQT